MSGENQVQALKPEILSMSKGFQNFDKLNYKDFLVSFLELSFIAAYFLSNCATSNFRLQPA